MVELEFVLCREWGICLPFATFFRVALIAVIGGLGFVGWWLFYNAIGWTFDRIDDLYWKMLDRAQSAARRKDDE